MHRKDFKQAKDLCIAAQILFFGNQNLIKFYNPEKVNVHINSHSTTSHSYISGGLSAKQITHIKILQNIEGKIGAKVTLQ